MTERPQARSISWLKVRPKAKSEIRVGNLDMFDEVKYRASALSLGGLRTIFDTSTDTAVAGITSNIDELDPRRSTGLDAASLAKSKSTFGQNAIPFVPETTSAMHFLLGFLNPYSMLLILAGALSLIAYGLDMKQPENLGLFFVLWTVVLLTNWITVPKPAHTLAQKFEAVRAKTASVSRNGQVSVVSGTDVFPGDIVHLAKGVKVAADVRLISTDGTFLISEEALTGDAKEVKKSAIFIPTIAPARKCENIVLQGSIVVSGSAVALVISTGTRTFMGRMYLIAGDKLIHAKPIHADIERLVSGLSIFSFMWALIMFIVGVCNDATVTSRTLIFTVGIIVATVPEGLLSTIMASMSMTTSLMRSHGLAVPDIETAETLGMVSCIVCDRTVFTQGKLTVAQVYCSGKVIESKAFDMADPNFRTLVDSVTLCSDASWVSNPKDTNVDWRSLTIDKRSATGDQIDVAALRFAETQYAGIGETAAEQREKSWKLSEVPFIARNNWMLHVRKMADHDENRGYMKGAFERIRKMCDHVSVDGADQPMTRAHQATIATAANNMAKKGYRILGIAQMVFPPHKYFPSQSSDPFRDAEARNNFANIGSEDAEGLFRDKDVKVTFIGLIGIEDPPHPSCIEAVQRCRDAGIKLVITTGEHGWSTKAFGKQIGFLKGVTVEDMIEGKFGWDTICTWGFDEFRREEQNLTIEEQSRITSKIIAGHIVEGWNPAGMDEGWRRTLESDEVIFSRTTPAQKRTIVDHYRMAGHVVAVTGSAVHDCPALKTADVGICCGTSPAEVTVETADIVCLETDFSSIVRGIEQGRLIFDNLKKSIAYSLSSNIAQLVPFLLYAVIRLPLPMTATLCLVIDLITDFIPALAFAYERPEGDIMKRPPPQPTDGVYTRPLLMWSYWQIGVMQAMGAMYTYFTVMSIEGYQAEVLWWRGWFYFTPHSPPFNNHSVQENILSLQLVQTAYFASIVLMQLAVALVVKTRRQSIFTHGMQNYFLNIALVFSFVAACFIIYVPGVRDFFGTRQLPFVYWLPSVPWAVLIFEYDELRKLVMRSFGNGRIERLNGW